MDPIFTIALGDTIQQKDLLIKDVQYNEIAFLGNDFPIAVLLEGYHCNNKVVELKLYDRKSLLHKQKMYRFSRHTMERIKKVMKKHVLYYLVAET